MDLLKKYLPWCLLLMAPYIGLMLMSKGAISDDQTTYFLSIDKRLVEGGDQKFFALGENILFWLFHALGTQTKALSAYYVISASLYFARYV